jgi:DNA mismatch repair ATPase MutS
VVLGDAGAAYMRLDAATAAALELVQPRSSVAGAHAASVLQWLGRGRVRTHGGWRLLRASLLQPLNDAASINARLACVGARPPDMPRVM